MSHFLREAFNRMRSFFGNNPLDQELDRALASHLEMAVEENVQRGLPWLDVMMQDLSFTFRTMRRDRTFTIVAVLILALGIGANVAVFSVVNTIMLRPLPFRDSQRLVRIVEKNPAAGESSKTYTADATQDIQQQNHSFQSVSGYFAFTGPDNFKLIGHEQPVPLTGILVAEGFFQTLGGRTCVGAVIQG